MSYLGERIAKNLSKVRGEPTYDKSGLREWENPQRQAKQDKIKSIINRGKGIKKSVKS